MITKNFYKELYGMLAKKSTKIINTGNEEVTSKIDGYASAYSLACAYMEKMVNALSGTAYGVIIGTGDTPPTFDDYTLSGDIISNYSYTLDSLRGTHDDNGCTIVGVYTITNTGSESFTISEVGILGNNASGNSNLQILLDRSILELPITVEAGGYGQITYTIRLDYPTT